MVTPTTYIGQIPGFDWFSTLTTNDDPVEGFYLTFGGAHKVPSNSVSTCSAVRLSDNRLLVGFIDSAANWEYHTSVLTGVGSEWDYSPEANLKIMPATLFTNQSVALDSTRTLHVVRHVSDEPQMQAFVVTTTGSNVSTIGATTTFNAVSMAGWHHGMVFLSTDKAAIFYRAVDSRIYTRIITVTGTSCSVGAPIQITTTQTYAAEMWGVKVSNNRAAIICRNDFNAEVLIVDYNTGAGTASLVQEIDLGTTSTNNQFAIGTLNATKILTARMVNDQDLQLQIVEFNGTTWAATLPQLANTAAYATDVGMMVFSEYHVGVAYYEEYELPGQEGTPVDERIFSSRIVLLPIDIIGSSAYVANDPVFALDGSADAFVTDWNIGGEVLGETGMAYWDDMVIVVQAQNVAAIPAQLANIFPATIAVSTSVGSAAIQGTVVAPGNTIVVTTSMGVPTITALQSQDVFPTTIAVTTAVGAPTIVAQFGTDVPATTIPVTTSIGTVSLDGSITTFQTTIPVTTLMDPATVTAIQNATPAPAAITVVTSMGAPTIRQDQTRAVATIAVTTTVGAPSVVTSTVSPFTSISGLRAHWRADTIGVSDGSSVSSWNDISGNAYTLTANSGEEPFYDTFHTINGKPVVRFDYDPGRLLRNASVLSGLTGIHIFAVFQAPNDGAVGHNGGFWRVSGGSASNPTQIPASDASAYDGTGSTTRKLSNSFAGSPYSNSWVYEVISTSSEWTSRFETVNAATTATNTPSFASEFWLGASRDESNSTIYYGDMRFAEVVIFTGKLSTTDRNTVVHYFNTRYGFGYP